MFNAGLQAASHLGQEYCSKSRENTAMNALQGALSNGVDRGGVMMLLSDPRLPKTNSLL